MSQEQSSSTAGRSITGWQVVYLLVAAVALTATGVMWASGYQHTIATALLVVAVAIGILGWRAEVSDEARRSELRELRGELRHYAEVVEMMAADMEAAAARNERAIERAHKQGAAEANLQAQAERQRLVEQHQAELALRRIHMRLLHGGADN
ncbi:hypothetical protein AB0873_15110 [Micromonospora sp. NPDC047707]|uniref:hypothetical protein n=1 Tax=Micromonospora sp. NPDC047707 TaxID=3154498 RepID=UPI0034558D27